MVQLSNILPVAATVLFAAQAAFAAGNDTTASGSAPPTAPTGANTTAPANPPANSGTPTPPGNSNSNSTSTSGGSGNGKAPTGPTLPVGFPGEVLPFNPVAPPAQCEATCGPFLALMIMIANTQASFGATPSPADLVKLGTAICTDDNLTKQTNCLDCQLAANSSIPVSVAQHLNDRFVGDCAPLNLTVTKQNVSAQAPKAPGAASAFTISSGVALGALAFLGASIVL